MESHSPNAFATGSSPPGVVPGSHPSRVRTIHSSLLTSGTLPFLGEGHLSSLPFSAVGTRAAVNQGPSL